MRMSLTALCVVALFSLGHAYEVVEPQMTMRPGAILAGRFGPVAEFSDGTSGFTKPATYRKTAVQLVDGLWETLVGIDATNGIAINDMVALDNGTYFIAFNGYVLESCGFIARYDPGVGLTCLETGLNSAPTSLVYEPIRDQLWISGLMTKPNGRNNEKIGLLGHMVIWQGRWIAPPFYGLDQMPKRLRLEPKTGTVWAVGEFTTTLDNRQPNGDRSYHVPLTASCDPANCGSPAMLATNNVANYADWVTNITSTTITATFGVADTIIHGLRVRGSSLSGYDTLSFAAKCDGTDATVKYWDPLRMESLSNVATATVFNTRDYSDYVKYEFDSAQTCSTLTLELTASSGKFISLSGLEIFTNAIVLDDEFNHLDTDVSFVGSYEYDTSDVDNRHVTLMVSNDSSVQTSMTFSNVTSVDGKYNIVILFVDCVGDCLGAITFQLVKPDGTTLDTFVAAGGTQTINNLSITRDTKLRILLPSSAEEDPGLMAAVQKITISRVVSHIFPANTYLVGFNTADPSSLKLLDNSLPAGSVVNDIAFTGDMMVIGGAFSLSGTGAYYNIVSYSLTTGTFSSFPGAGLQGTIQAIAPLGDDESFVAVGSITRIYSRTYPNVDGIAIFRNGEWEAAGDGYSGTATIVDVVNGTEIFIANLNPGSISGVRNAGDVKSYWDTARQVARFSLVDNKWQDMAPVIGTINVITHNATGHVVMGGFIASTFSANGNSLVMRGGNTWMSLNNSMPLTHSSVGQPYVRKTLYFKDMLYAIGTFSHNDADAGYRFACIARYNFTALQWQPLVEDMAFDSCELYDMVDGGDLLFIVGFLSGSVVDPEAPAGRVSLTNVFAFDGTVFTTPVAQFSYTTSPVYSIYLEWSGSTPNIYVGVNRALYGNGTECNGVCMWDGEKWNALGLGLNTAAMMLKVMDGYLIAAGSFTSAGGAPVRYIAKYNLRSGVWSMLGGYSLNSAVSSFTGSSLDSLYVSGNFNLGSNMRYLGKYNREDDYFYGVAPLRSGSVSSIHLVPGTNLPPNDVLPSGQVLLALGQFNIYGVGFVGAAFFDGQNWRPVLSVDAEAASATGTPTGAVYIYTDGPYTGLLPYQIALIAVFSVILFVILLALLIFCIIRSRRNKSNDSKENNLESNKSGITVTSAPAAGSTTAVAAPPRPISEVSQPQSPASPQSEDQ